MSQSSVLTIGNFDGVHVAHRAILRRAREIAEARAAALLVLTFEPHPATVLRPGHVPARITTAAEKAWLLRDAGVDDVMVLEPTPALLGLEPAAFVRKVLVPCRPATVVEGADFRFGRDRGGDTAILQSLGRRMGFDVQIVQSIQVALCDQTLTPVSSSLIRWLLGHGRVADAARCLGRAFALTGRIAVGERRGRSLGVPTANLEGDDIRDHLVPGPGVYAGLARLPDGDHRPAAISVGAKPTFGAGSRVVEAHLLGFDGDLYDRRLTLLFTRWLREQRPFPDADLLRRQLQRDIERVRALHADGHLSVPLPGPHEPSGCASNRGQAPEGIPLVES